MGWTETCAVEERMRFVLAVQEHEESFAAVCRQFGVSRRVGYKWLARFEEEGAAGLFDRPRVPLHQPQRIADSIAERCLEVRRAHPTWGPLKVRAFLARKSGQTEWPAASTIGELFDREGLTVKRKLRRRSPPSSAPFADCEAANDTWCIDFKGWFLTGDGKRCEPLTLTDAYSRYLLRCQALARTDTDHVWPVLDAAFREFGLPYYLRSDNGSPFASRGAGGLSRLSVKLIKAGVTPERIAPGKPQQNGRHERMHLTLLQEVASPPARNMREQHERLRSFRQFYNEERPHQALDHATPADRYQPSARRFDGVLRKPDYDNDRDVRSVRRNGDIKWQGNTIYISEALVGEPVGLTENESGWTVSYGPILLGAIERGRGRLRKPKRKTKGCGLEDNATRCPQGPQPPTTTDLNETRIVLPMSSV
jgi:transposase InsO family protein